MNIPLAMACVLAVGVITPPTSAQSKPASCQAPELRQFDFWVGRWNVFDAADKKVGENVIESIDSGCVLLERWRGNGGFTGSSLNSWSAVTKQWHQHWVDNQGGLLRLSGAFEGGRMVLAASEPDPKKPGSLLCQRITWTALPDGSVRQLWEQSAGGGAAWTTVFDGRNTRQP